MRTLEQSLMEHELIALRVIGEWWELDLTGQDKHACVQQLAGVLGSLDMETEMRYLPPEEAAALRDLARAGGRMPLPVFARRYGEVRQMGPGRLEREEPWLAPANVAEALWYRGFLYSGFDETAEGMLAFYYLPGELLTGLPAPEMEETAVVAERDSDPLAPVAPPSDYETAVIHAVDDLTAVLAGAHLTGLTPEGRAELTPLLLDPDPDRLSLLITLAHEAGFLRRKNGRSRPTRDAVAWLRQTREAQSRRLAEAWSSSNWNELCHVPELVCEGEGWENDPILARTALLEAIPRHTGWFRVADLVAHIKETDPDFQRPDGNYDTWYLRERESDTYITGFENWERVEGRLIVYLITRPLVWLGLAETGVTAEEEICYRLTDRALAWLSQQPVPEEEVVVPLVVQEDGTLLVPFNAGRYQRFQAARISEPLPATSGEPFLYCLTPDSLARAGEEGIAVERVLEFLAEASQRPLPAGVKRAVERWAERGTEARLETAVVLRVRDEAILETLLQNPRTRPFIGERLGLLAAAIRRDQWEAFRQATVQLGLFLEIDVT